MKTTYILLTCGCGKSIWQPVINAIPGICWGLLGLLFIYLALRFVAAPIIANCHELIVKEANNKHEDKLADKKEKKDSELKQKANELEIAILNRNLAQQKLKVYEDFYKMVEFDVRLKDDRSKE